MKKLYILLLVLILVYINVNLAYSYFNPDTGFTNLFTHDKEMEGNNDTNTIIIGTSSFEKISNFTETSIDSSAVSLFDSRQNITINVSEISDSQNLTETVKDLLLNDNTITSNQTVDQNGVTVYYLYDERIYDYDANIYFSKDGKNYLIKGDNIRYENSNYFIKNCKDIINSIGKKEEKGFKRWN